MKTLWLWLLTALSAAAQLQPSGLPDTSFNVAGAFRQLQKSHPQATRVPDAPLPGVAERHGLAYGQTPGRKLLLDAFLPKANPNGIGILLIHGGGWRSGDRTHHYPLARRLAARGYAVFCPEYLSLIHL